jgi:uncharacterized protein
VVFLDREKELRLLRSHLGRPGAGMFVLYGRRRIGKTALLDEALRGLPRAIYHVGTRSAAAEELAGISRALARGWGMPLLDAQPLASPEALVAVLESVREPSILALDEFPYLAESAPSLPGLLQASWDRNLSRGPLKLVFCGSSVSVMEGTFLSPRSPLFGRRTGQLRLGPLPPSALSQAFPWKPPELVELAAVFGTSPGVLARLNPSLDLAANLRGKVLTKGEPLYEEVPFLLREELREPRVYQSILSAIAGGARKFGEISSKAGLDRANLSRYLSSLSDLGMVERETPVCERLPDKSRKGLYRISDPFVATWFAFVHPYRDELERGNVDAVFEQEILPRLAQRLPQAVEPVIRDLIRSAGKEIVPFPVDALGRQWGAGSEFDLVALDREGRRAFVAEIKWSREKTDPRLLDDLRRRAEREPAFEGRALTPALISRSGFAGRRRAGKDERLIDLSGPHGRQLTRGK